MDLLEGLSEEDWDAPTVCPGWSVKDIALHLLGVEIGNLSTRRDGWHTPGPDDPTRLGSWVADFNESWVSSTRRMSTRLLSHLLGETAAEMEQYFATVDLSDVTAVVSWASADPVPMWLDVAREYTERWVHQQQIRDAIGRPP